MEPGSSSLQGGDGDGLRLLSLGKTCLQYLSHLLMIRRDGGGVKGL